MFSTAARAAPEWTIPGIPLCGDRVTLRTFPDSWGMNALVAAAWVISQVPSTLSSITVRKPFGDDRLGRAQELAAGVVDQHVDPAVALDAPRRRANRPPPRRGCPSRPPRRRLRAARSPPPSPRAAPAGGRSRSPSRRAGQARGPSRGRGREPAPETTQTWPSSSPGAKIREALGRHGSSAGYTAATVAGAMKVRAEHETARTDRLPGGTPGRHRRGRADPRPAPCASREPRSSRPPASRRCACSGSGRRSRSGRSCRCPAFLIRHPTAGVVPGRHRPARVDRRRRRSRTSAGWSPGSCQPRGRARTRTCPPSCASRGVDPKSIPLVVMTHLHVDHASGDVGVPERDLRDHRGRVDAATTDSRPLLRGYRRRPLRLRLRLPHAQLRLRPGQLLRDLRPHLRPVRRRQRPARLHARPQRRPPVGDLPPARSRPRDRRRRDLHDRPARRCARARRARSTATTGGARCTSCSSSPARIRRP